MIPFYQAPDGALYLGDCRAVLANLPAESVHCVVTSPPYWGLRDYQIPPVVWGGSGECTHDWDVEMLVRRRGTGHGANAHVGNTLANVAGIVLTQGRVCSRCGAWLGCMGNEPTPQLYVSHLVEVFRAVWRVLRRDGTLWLNLGDSYAGSPSQHGCDDPAGTKQSGNKGSLTGASRGAAYYPFRPQAGRADGVVDERGQRNRNGNACPPGFKPKDMIGVPWRVALALQEAGWWLRRDIIWHKPTAMPESCQDRPSTDHEYLFILTKAARYYYDAEAVKVPCSGSAHPRGSGVNPKARPMPGGWQQGPGAHDVIEHNQGSRVRQNASYSAAITKTVELRNLRSVWTIRPQPFGGDHYATYPEALVRPCILAGSSALGCCLRCGRPWKREIVTVHVPVRPGRRQRPGRDQLAGAHGPDGSNGTRYGLHVETIGWVPGCKCSDPMPGPAVILDPFMGTGTTALVSRSLGRHWLGIDASADYAGMARRRIEACSLPLPVIV